ncbi:hypothetical protein EON82_14495 [bacterium]|nr:MAG: hypothetical protein EON82_14495 [bacterium]
MGRGRRSSGAADRAGEAAISGRLGANGALPRGGRGGRLSFGGLGTPVCLFGGQNVDLERGAQVRGFQRAALLGTGTADEESDRVARGGEPLREVLRLDFLGFAVGPLEKQDGRVACAAGADDLALELENAGRDDVAEGGEADGLDDAVLGTKT